MTSATIAFAMVPLALKLEAGGETRSPIAVVLMGGVISSTLLTLLIVPTAYTVLEDIAGLPRRLLRSRAEAPTASISANRLVVSGPAPTDDDEA